MLSKKYMQIGLIGALITAAGELCQGYAPSINTADKMTALFSSFDNLPVWRIGSGSTIGAIGILLQFFGVYAIYLSFENKNTRVSKIYYYGMYVFSIIGSTVHILMSFMVYAYKIGMDALVEVTIWFVLPTVVLFFIGYIPFAVVMTIQFYQKQTPFPKWIWLLNPLFGKVFFNVITTILPSSALTNGISYSNMGLSSVVLFAVLLYYQNNSLDKKSEAME